LVVEILIYFHLIPSFQVLEHVIRGEQETEPTRNTDPSSQVMYSFQIKANDVEPVRKRCIEMDYPLLEEYDYKRDMKLMNVKMDLKASTRLRAYQDKCLSKMFSNGRARSGSPALFMIEVSECKSILMEYITTRNHCLALWRR